jgi:hypothetical protein
MSIWEKYPDYSGDELRVLVSAAVQVLSEYDSSNAPDEQVVSDISPMAVSRRLITLLQNDKANPVGPEISGDINVADVREILEDQDLAADVCLKILGEIRSYPELAEQITEVYQNKEKKMAIPPAVLLAGALTILALRIKIVQVGKGKVKIEFFKSGSVVKEFIIKMLKGFGG